MPDYGDRYDPRLDEKVEIEELPYRSDPAAEKFRNDMRELDTEMQFDRLTVAPVGVGKDGRVVEELQEKPPTTAEELGQELMDAMFPESKDNKDK